MSSLKESLRVIVQNLTQAEELLAGTGIKDDVLTKATINKLTTRTQEVLKLVTTNELLFLKNQANKNTDKNSIKNLKLNIKILSLEQKSDKLSLNRAKTDDEKSTLQSILSSRAWKIKTLHSKLIQAKQENTK